MRIDRSALGLIGVFLLLSSLAWGEEPTNLLQEESRHLYQVVPDAEITMTQGRGVRLSQLWAEKPLLITLFFNQCSGTCSPFLHALKSAVDSTGGLGKDYRILSLSFDPQDTVEDVDQFSTSLGITDKENWIFGITSQTDVTRIAEAIGFWYKLEPKTRQYDHPTLLAAVRDGKIVRVVLEQSISKQRFREVVMDLKGNFVPFYSRPGEKTLFRCLQVDEKTQEVRLDWGLLILLFPGVTTLFLAGLMFRNSGFRSRP